MHSHPTADEARARAAAVLRALKGYRRVSDQGLAKAAGVSRSMVQEYATNKSQLTVGLMAAFSTALHVHPKVFLMTPDDALRWTMDNSPNGVEGDLTSTGASTTWNLRSFRFAPMAA